MRERGGEREGKRRKRDKSDEGREKRGREEGNVAVFLAAVIVSCVAIK